MSYALGEIEALAKRAIRGANLPWGLAEDVAKAVRWLASYDLEGPMLLANVLRQDDGISMPERTPDTLEGDWSCASGYLSPLICGPSLGDTAKRLLDGPVTLKNVTHPLLLLPFAANAARLIALPVSLKWDGAYVSTDGKSVSIEGDGVNEQAAMCVTCQVAPKYSASQKPSLRGVLSDATLEHLMEFAERAFAPITEHSRKLGAGASLTDND